MSFDNWSRWWRFLRKRGNIKLLDVGKEKENVAVFFDVPNWPGIHPAKVIYSHKITDTTKSENQHGSFLQNLLSTFSKSATNEETELQIPNNLEDIAEDLLELNFKRSESVTFKYDVNVILQIPDYFSGFQNLVRVALEGHNLALGQNSPLFELQSLEDLRMIHCQLEILPDNIGNLKKLKLLNLYGNFITQLPDSLFSIHSLTILSVAKNKLLHLSERLNDLCELEDLILSGNHLTEFPVITNDEMKLEKLIIPGNYITHLHESIGKLKCMKNLYLSDNKLLYIPDTLGYLIELKLLFISSNSITCLPESIVNLKPDHLHLNDNPLQKPPLDICLKGINAICGYFEALGRFNGYHSNRAKIILVGESMAGKTSLCQAMITCRRQSIDIDSRTEGIDLFKWKVRPELDDFEVLVVDCAGQRKYMITHKCFMSQGSLFLLVVDLYAYERNVNTYRKSVGSWIDVILAQVPDATIIIVPTHLDLFEKEDQKIILQRCQHILENVWKDNKAREKALAASRIDNCVDVKNKEFLPCREHSSRINKSHLSAVLWFKGEVYKYSDSSSDDTIKMIPISSKGDLEGIGDLRNEIIGVLINAKLMPLVGREVPSIYPELEEYCVDQRNITPVIKLEEFIVAVQLKFEISKEIVVSALHYFDTTGSVLYFSYGNELDQFIFLDPVWFIDVLKRLFCHNMDKKLVFKDEYIDLLHLSVEEFKQYTDDFLGNARLNTQLLRCIWHDIEYVTGNNDAFHFLIEILCRFHLIIDLGNQEEMFGSCAFTMLVPWYLNPATDIEINKHWPTKKGENVAEVICQFDSIVSPLPIGSFERFVAVIYGLFDCSIAFQDTFIGIQEHCKIYCEMENYGRCGKFTFKGRCENDNVDKLWKTLLPIFKIAENFFVDLPGLGCMKSRSLCPSCISNSLNDPYMFIIPCWFTHTPKRDHVACQKEHKPIPINLLFPSKDVIHEFEMENEIENATSLISNDKIDSILIEDISQLIGARPQSLGRCLGLPHHKIEILCYDNRHQVTEQNVGMMTSWIHQVGHLATVRELYKCLIRMKPKPKDALNVIRNYQPS